MTQELEIFGFCDPRFAKVKTAFIENMRTRNEIGASVSVVYRNEPAVHLWAGLANPKDGTPWRENTIVNVFSTTKGVTAICAHRLVEEGRLDLDAPVADYWPEFAQAGKAKIPVRWLLSHRAGLAAVKPLLPPEALYDWKAMTDALAKQEPWWTPGEKHGYHAITYGWLVGEVIRRITGKSVGRYLKDELCKPLGLDLHIGLGDEEIGRAARVKYMKGAPEDPMVGDFMKLAYSNPEGVTARAFANPISITNGVNREEWRRAEIPSANGHCTAFSLARLYGALANGGNIDGVHVLGPEAIERCCREESYGMDAVLGFTTRFSLGFMLSQPMKWASFGPGARSFGHPGAGGSVGFADPDAGIGFGYVTNRMGSYILIDPRATTLIDAAYESIG